MAVLPATPPSTRLRVTAFEGPAEEWDAFVRQQPRWTHFHLYGWRAVMSGPLKHDTLYRAARDEHGTIVGVHPLVRVKSLLFGHYLVSMPFVNYGGPLGSDEAVQALANDAQEIARAQKVDMLELRSRTELPLGMPVSHRKITVLLDIPEGGSDALWKQIPAKVRSQVRRPQKEGVTVTFGADQVEPFFRIFAHHMRDLGTPTQSRQLFETIAKTFPNDVTFGCAYLRGVPIACGCGFRWDDEFEITWASSLREYNNISPNMLLYWGFMEHMANTGVRIFNFGRCTPDSGTHKFKRQWGSRDERLWWYEQRAPGVKTPAEGDGAIGYGPTLWKKLPLPVATALGPHIVRFIP